MCVKAQLRHRHYLDIYADDYMTSMYRPMSPILTRRAMHETPKPGHLTDQSNLPQSSADIISKCSIRPVEEQVLDEPSINVEEVL